MSTSVPEKYVGALLRAAVAALPDTADGVADLVRAARLKGKRRSAGDCALARFFGGMFGGPFIVGPSGIFRFLGPSGPGRRYEYARPTAAVVDFVERFDRGEYPDLVA